MTTIRLGSSGVDVLRWQRIVGVSDEAGFGVETHKATLAWQAAHALVADGIVGEKTWGVALALDAAPIAASVRAVFFDFNRPLEGLVPYFYADILGLITIGVGNLVDPVERALNLPMRRDTDNVLASRDEIIADWKRVKFDPNAARLGHRYVARQKLTRLHLTEADIRVLVNRRVDENVKYLARVYPAFWTWPADATLAVLSVAWAVGAGFGQKLRKLHAALLAGDFETACAECTIREKGNPGVIPRNIANRVLFALADETVRKGLDRSVLHYEVPS